KSWVGARRPRSSKNSYARCNSPVLQRLVELAQYTSIKLTTRLMRAGVEAVGDSYGNAMMESFWAHSALGMLSPVEYELRTPPVA
ncbi:hypothetical protein, partial [Streptomyces sp. NPDC050564]|uniref:hypothetical protein n=1 Tax=Streptomyces sp. NPDC050564 TaxID=3365631 RepID=UPI0037BCF7DD